MDLTQLIDHPELMNKETLYDLRSIVALYPYYQTARLLMLQNLYLLHDSSFDDELRRAAVFIADRTKLFDLVEASHYRLHQDEAAAQREHSTASQDKDGRTMSLIDSYLGQLPGDDTAGKKPPHRKPTPTDAAIDYVAYLMDTEGDKDTAQQQAETPQLKGQALIDDFINNDNGKIQLKDKPEYVPQLDDDGKDGDTQPDDGFFTETLAKIYIKQGRYSKALEIIKRLNLNYPKKNAYFADQIRFLQKLILNNKNNKQ